MSKKIASFMGKTFPSSAGGDVLFVLPEQRLLSSGDHYKVVGVSYFSLSEGLNQGRGLNIFFARGLQGADLCDYQLSVLLDTENKPSLVWEAGVAKGGKAGEPKVMAYRSKDLAPAVMEKAVHRVEAALDSLKGVRCLRVDAEHPLLSPGGLGRGC